MIEAAPEETLSPGAQLGRFVVVRQLGAGGMGEVYEARDPELGRSVAVKVLRTRAGGRDGALRLVREAQALAQLQHPNVVAVHDVGVTGDRVFIAMEFVDGETLHAVLDGGRSSQAEVIGLLVQAGRGLAAAHARSIVHRDFKPANVLVDRDGRVRVADFGLARMAGAAETSGLELPAGHPSLSEQTTEAAGGETLPVPEKGTVSPGLLGSPLTGAGALIGTPRYMSPEQHSRLAATARSDQYAFCVVAWEALFGEHPFERDPRPRRPAPRWLVRALETGLATDPARRHPSMSELVALLESAPARRKRLAVAGGALFVVTAAAAAAVVARPARVDCELAGSEVAGVWAPEKRDGLAAAFAAASPFGADVASRLGPRLDEYARSWKDARAGACRAAHERGEESPEMLDRRAACLGRGLMSLRALVDGLAPPDPPAIAGSLDAASALPPVEDCSAARLGAAFPVDLGATPVHESLARARADLALGRVETARAAAERALSAARDLGDPGLRAAALAQHGRILAREDTKRARAELEEALGDAARAGARELNAEIFLDLLDMVIDDWAADRVESLLPVARAAVAGAGPTSPARIELAAAEAQALLRLGRYEEVAAACDRIAALEPAARPLRASFCRCELATVRFDPDAAEEVCQRVVDLRTEAYGPSHPDVARALLPMANVFKRRGKEQKALVLEERALSILEGVVGDHRDLVSILGNLGTTLGEVGRPAEGTERYRQAIAMANRIGDRPNKQIADLHFKLAARLVDDAATRDEAVRHADESMRIYEEVLPPGHRQLAVARLGHGMTHLDAGHPEIALESLRRGHELAEKGFSPKHALAGVLLDGQANCLLKLGRPREAVPAAEKAVAILASAQGDPVNLAAAHATLGESLLAVGDRARARRELALARDLYIARGPAWASRVDS